jgi:hypothetical protein
VGWPTLTIFGLSAFLVYGTWAAWQGIGYDVRHYGHSARAADGGNTAYVSYWDFGTVMLDVSDPANPEFLGRTEFGPGVEGNAHSAWTARGGRLLIQTDEDFDPTPNPDVETGWGYGHIFDISDKSNPVELATLKLPSTHQFPPPGPGDFTIHDPKIRGSVGYFSWYSEGVVMFDLSDPANPEFLAQFIPPPDRDPMGFRPGEFPNTWGVFVHKDVVLASDIHSGLWVFKLDRSGQR